MTNLLTPTALSPPQQFTENRQLPSTQCFQMLINVAVSVKKIQACGGINVKVKVKLTGCALYINLGQSQEKTNNWG